MIEVFLKPIKLVFLYCDATLERYTIYNSVSFKSKSIIVDKNEASRFYLHCYELGIVIDKEGNEEFFKYVDMNEVNNLQEDSNAVPLPRVF